MHSVGIPPNVDRPLGGALPPRDRESEREIKGTESRAKKYHVARALLPIRVDILCQYVGVPPEGSKGQRGNISAEIKNTMLLVHCFLFPPNFYVKVWVFPRMGPKDNGGTHR